MASDFSQLSRGQVCHKVVGWLSCAFEDESYIFYLRDDHNRDLLVEVDEKAKVMSLLHAVVDDRHRHPIVIGECHIWYYEAGRQLCAKVTPNSGLGIVRTHPREWKWSTGGLANVYELGQNQLDRIDFFVFIVPDNSAWYESHASNGNKYSQLVLNLPEGGKGTIQIWHRDKPGDIPRLEHPNFPEGTAVCLTNANLKVFSNSLMLSSSAWSVLVPMEDCVSLRGVTQGQIVVPPEVFDVNQIKGVPYVDSSSSVAGEMMWVTEPKSEKSPKNKEKIQTISTGRKKSSTTVAPEDNKKASSKKERSTGSDNVKSEPKKMPEKKIDSPRLPLNPSMIYDEEEDIPTQFQKSGPLENSKSKREKKSDIYPSFSAYDGGDENKVRLTSESKDSKPGAKVCKKPFPSGLKGSDMVGKRVTVRGRGSGIITGGGPLRIRVIFDQDAAFKTESAVSVDKVFLE